MLVSAFSTGVHFSLFTIKKNDYFDPLQIK